MSSLLNSLQLPQEINTLSHEELGILAREIREKLLEIGDACGGHLASNLGVVELTLALHCVLSTPTDKIVWDVSHQTYVHKILTGRLDRMFTIRQKGGLSGFSKITESEHDMFGAGHASTALSAALGMAHARDLKGESNSVVAVIGDATLSGGMAFEALNNVENLKSNFVCILNDNDMSISEPTGSLATYMTKLRTSRTYNSAKHKFERILARVPKIGVPLSRKIEKVIERMRDIVFDFKFGVIFEEFGFKYLGPLDGHDLPVLIAALNYAKNYPGPIMIHVITKKGKGHLPAEADPFTYHGVSPKKKPAKLNTEPPTPSVALKSYTEIFGDTMIEIAKTNPRLMVVTPAMKIGSGLVKYAQEFPRQFIDVGIAEEHAVTYCGGLATNGVKPVLAIYSTFLQRGFDQVIHDVCLQKLAVVFALDRAGLVGEDGPTHHGVFDYAFLLPIPNLMILAPKDGPELVAMLKFAVQQNISVSVRYPKGTAPVLDTNTRPIEMGKSELLVTPQNSERARVLIIAAGSMVTPAIPVAEKLNSQNIACALINLRFIKPLDAQLLSEWIPKSDHVFVLEEGCVIGGIYAHILQEINHLSKPVSEFHSIALPDEFIDHAKVSELHDDYGLSETKILNTITEKIR